MTYQALTFRDFGGLDVLSDPAVVSTTGAQDLLNVSLDRPGSVRTRDGVTVVGATASTGNIRSGLAYYVSASGVEFLVYVDDTGTAGADKFTAVNLATGANVASVISAAPGGTFVRTNNAFARFGDPSNQRLYAGTSSVTMQRFDGTTWTTVAPGGLIVNTDVLAVTPVSKRLAAGERGVAGSARVQWSDAGAPETFTSSNVVNFDPGDGQALTALIPFQNSLFIFKQGKIFEQFSESIDTTGNPIFNYRRVTAAQGASLGAAVAGERAIYFANPSGIYGISSGAPVYLSRPLEPWLRAGTFGNLPTISLSQPTLSYSNGVLYVTDTGNNCTILFDTLTEKWSVWQLAAPSIVGVPPASAKTGLWLMDGGSKKVAKVDSTATTDNGSAITWRWQSGVFAPGDADPTTIRETLLWGKGSPTLSVFSDYGSTDASAATVTLGVSAEALGRRRTAFRGVFFSHKLSGTSPASVSRITHHLRERRAPGINHP